MLLCICMQQQYAIILFWFVNLVNSQTFSQSRFDYLSPGKQFLPANFSAQLISTLSTNSLRRCAIACHMQSLCRIFDYEVYLLQQCRLFEGDLTTMGSAISSPSANSRVGVLQTTSTLFAAHGLSCPSQCEHSRYLTCKNDSTCECFPHHYWDSSMCLPQSSVVGSPCNQSKSMCRQDIQLFCLRLDQCGPLSIYAGVTIANQNSYISGSSNGVLSQPMSIAVNQSIILIADGTGNQIVQFSYSTSPGNNGSVVFRNWTTGESFSHPNNIYLDVRHGNNLYVSDAGNNRIIMFSNMQSTLPAPKIVAGTGSGGNSLNSPSGVRVDSHGNMIISDFFNNRVLKYAPNSTSGYIIAGTGSAGSDSMSLNNPSAMHLDEYNSWLYVVDTSNHRVQRYFLNGSIPMVGTTVAGNNGAGSGSNQLRSPYGIWVSNKTGAIYIADTMNNRIQRWKVGAASGVTVAGSPTGVVGSNSTMLNSPYRVTADVNETYLYVSDTSNKRIQRFQLI
ncbi:unnamed protein product [Adineta ricciae]|uniref:Uncharacterized protein n=1 Tax=Adineta ricciae TaxID=249248 RepID=A0A814NHZ5_ADIRI|nr:unnamed protein product [Adineta ricciae]CAF1224511.1 unnamed protein product [Adineta ricciae]